MSDEQKWKKGVVEAIVAAVREIGIEVIVEWDGDAHGAKIHQPQSHLPYIKFEAWRTRRKQWRVKIWTHNYKIKSFPLRKDGTYNCPLIAIRFKEAVEVAERVKKNHLKRATAHAEAKAMLDDVGDLKGAIVPANSYVPRAMAAFAIRLDTEDGKAFLCDLAALMKEYSEGWSRF